MTHPLKVRSTMKKINCPVCGKELIRLEPYVENQSAFWCDDCNIDILVECTYTMYITHEEETVIIDCDDVDVL